MVCTAAASKKAEGVLGLDKRRRPSKTLPRQPPWARFERFQDRAGEPIEIARPQSKLGVDNRYKPGGNSAYETGPDALGSKEISGVGFVDYLTNAHYPSVLPKLASSSQSIQNFVASRYEKAKRALLKELYLGLAASLRTGTVATTFPRAECRSLRRYGMLGTTLPVSLYFSHTTRSRHEILSPRRCFDRRCVTSGSSHPGR